MKKLENIYEAFIFSSRWIQAPICGGLIVGSTLYSYKFMVELIHLCTHINSITEKVLHSTHDGPPNEH